ncbi:MULTISPECIES: AAA family ATPase [unclassified Rhizobium]|uniref:AAA family ATPase n=1 Tax=unclassified Rhizobium TaxID=2613769 RepID=UPI000BD119D2|nr:MULTISPECIES: AAA family ATPase [unclassified Rhizobium]MDH7806851.1 energy-coupling factor transporter ATP-binding protein EcfA2 [Rhizobium sp. AN67]SOD57691.1 AAA domain-containing protein [Rhizobium sp. AN6A]
MANYTVSVLNCNSIDRADVVIAEGALNIKYGPNGLGKSTIAKAIISHIRADGSLQELIPFKNRGKPDAPAPEVRGVDHLQKVVVFDDNYVQQFVFQKDEVVKNSFEIFIRTPEYLAEMAEIDVLLSGIRKAFSDNAEIMQVISDLKELQEAFGKSNTGAIPKTSKMHKAFGSGNKLENIPETLQPFSTFIKSQEPAKWIAWQVKGNEFLQLGDSCPYCSSALTGAGQKDTALAVEKEYDANTAGHINTLRGIIDRLGKYFSEKCQQNLEKVTKAKVSLQAEEQGFLTGLKAHIDALINKLEGLRTLSFFSLRDFEEVGDQLTPLKIDLNLIDTLDSAETRKTVDPINQQLDDLIGKVGSLKGKINRHKTKIKKTIEENQSSINGFLRSAGYKYAVEIVAEPESYKMKLVHKDQMNHIETASRHLSYGEKNAFALVLFMYQVLSEKPDLVVLDDPISSFDKNKKFAILHELFRGKASLRGKTTLMLTHDIEPAIDVIKSTNAVFQGAAPSACFLSSRAGVVTEVPIERNDIQTFAKICKDNIGALDDSIIKAIYLRRHFELQDDTGLEYNLLASLFKGRDTPTIKSGSSTRNMTADEQAAAETSIRENHIVDFDYASLVSEVKNVEGIKAKFYATNVGYEKIQLFRIINDEHDDSVIRKFINESYHIENEYVMQLNPHKFESIPEYVVEECAALLSPALAAA